ncbi:MAG: endonuclease/exonuclease/phosphatase family protein [Deltaproteobacteria bacterium]|nr:endonuclease/exonuclease/phosphatase family protein [Deltaproteobacteria bacterium]
MVNLHAERALWCAALVALAPGAAADGDAVELRAVSYNIAALSGGLPGVVETLRRLQPDVVALQEVDAGTARSGGVDQARALGRALGMEAQFVSAMPHDGGQYGLALLARGTLTPLRTVRLPRLHAEEPRIAQIASLRVGGLEWAVVNTHLAADWHAREPARVRALQARALQQALLDVGRADTPLLLLGDLNATPAEPPVAILAESLTLLGPPVATYPARAPTRALDHALLRPGTGLTRVRAEVRAEPSAASDHLPLVVDLVLRRVSAR